MRFFTSQNKQNNNNDYNDVTSSDYPQTVEIPTSSSSSPSSEDVVVAVNNDNNSDDDEGYDEFLRVCMNSMVSFYYYYCNLSPMPAYIIEKFI